MTSGSGLFDATASELERRTDMDALAARGTLRLALKSAGLDPKSVSPEQMAVALERVLPGELAPRGVDDAPAVCRALAASAREAAPTGAEASEGESPEQIFRRFRQGRTAAS